METENAEQSQQRPHRTSATRGLVETAWLLVVLALATMLFLARYEDPRRIASGDSFWYMSQALIFTGVDPEEARLRAGQQVCRDMNRSLVASKQPATCKNYVTKGFSPRYVAIFDSRPGYPLFAAPFVAVLGPWTGMMAATLILALMAALMAYLAVWLASGLRLAGVLAAALIFVLPTGFAMTRMLTESGVFAGYLAVLVGATLLLVRGRRTGLLLILAALAWLFALRSASGMAMALTLLGAGVLALLSRRHRGAGAAVGGVGLLAVVVWQVLATVLHLPGLNETIQDFATKHFKRGPDVADPIGWLIDRNLDFWPEILGRELAVPTTLAALLFAVVVLVRRMPDVAAPWILTGLTGVMMVVAHPLGSEYNRLMSPIWLPVACALGYAAALAVGGGPVPPAAAGEPPGRAPAGGTPAVIPRQREPEPAATDSTADSGRELHLVGERGAATAG